MANYTKKLERQRDAAEFGASMGNTRYTLFPNDFDPKLTVHGFTMEKAVRQLEEWSGKKVFLYRLADGHWGHGTNEPVVPKFMGPSSGGKIRFSHRSRSADVGEARREFGHGVILSGLGCFRGMHTIDFAKHLRTLKAFVQLDRMAPSEVYMAAKAKCWPRDVENLNILPRMARNVIEARYPPNVEARMDQQEQGFPNGS